MDSKPNPEPAIWPTVKPRREILGISAVFLPFEADGRVAWPAFRAHLERTLKAGLVPAVNMDTGFVQFLDDTTRRQVLVETRAVVSGREFVAGAFVADRPGDAFQIDGYRHAVDQVQEHGGLPIVFPSYGLSALPGKDILSAFDAIGRCTSRFLAFELGTMFAPFGRIFDEATFVGLLAIQACIGVKHSSLSRLEEWIRLRRRDEIRPEFRILTGNDWAIDMVMYGSDYLLGLSTFAPAEFALRDRLWATGDTRFFELNDLLQYLGHFAFRPPVAAYRRSAAQFLALRGWISSESVPPSVPPRPDSDHEVLRDILERLQRWTSR